MEQLRICRIQVSGLFGTLNYDIRLTENEPVSIITAPNGRGKTTILNLTSFIMQPAYETFMAVRVIPFDEFRCVLSNGKTVCLKQRRKAEAAAGLPETGSIRQVLLKAAGRTKTCFDQTDFEFAVMGDNGMALRTLDYAETFSESFRQDSSEYLPEMNEGDPAAELRISPLELRLNYIWKTQTRFLEEEGCLLPVSFIRADRIQPVNIPSRMTREFREPHLESPLRLAGEHIIRLIREATERYSEAVSQAKDRLPQMFIDGEGSDLDCGQFMQGWSVYRDELTRFQEIGLITPTEDFTKGKDIAKVYREKGSFLSAYLSAFRDTTAPLKDIYSRLNLFKQTLDERNVITGKKLVFGREGISLWADGREIPLEQLSSGEKHDFIMFYDLIFNISRNGLVLVDEPEISLHIEWQESYLDKLIAICRMNGLQAVVATHSPNIVSSHYDLLADKGETNGTR